MRQSLIGDHALNISKYVIYMAHGRDVRYSGTAVIEQEATREIKKKG